MPGCSGPSVNIKHMERCLLLPLIDCIDVEFMLKSAQIYGTAQCSGRLPNHDLRPRCGGVFNDRTYGKYGKFGTASTAN